MPTDPLLKVPPLPTPGNTGGKGRFGHWVENGLRLDMAHSHGTGHPWYQVLWLTGVDYFSTLGYQPGIALLAAGALSPIATAILVLVTLFCALPVYAQVARRSFVGQGSIAMIENLLRGWQSKVAVLVLVGFAATAWIVTITLSAADAAKHAIENPILHPYLINPHAQVWVTLGLLGMLAFVFIRGFKEAIYVSMAIALPYMVLSVWVLVVGGMAIAKRPDILAHWWQGLAVHESWAHILLASVIVFPKLALGLSGFETGVMVMPQVAGRKDDHHTSYPAGRVLNTQKLLAAAALIMSVMLIGSSLVTTLLIPAAAYGPHGPAEGRAIAYLAHELLGPTFGSLYDASTIAILWFAGASAMAGLLNLIPRYLPRFGMAPNWTIFDRPLILFLFAVSVVVTLVFKADVEAQAGAYATGVLVLMLSAAVAVAVSLWREAARRHAGEDCPGSYTKSLFYWLVSAVFTFTLIDNVVERRDGIIIASVFIFSTLGLSAFSRYQRAKELRVLDMAFVTPDAATRWPAVRGKRVNLVPLRGNDPDARRVKAAEVRSHFAIEGPLAFVHVNLVDNRSEFLASLRVNVEREEEDWVITVDGAVAIANTIAYVSELIDPRTLILGLTQQNLMNQALKYLLWGEGETGLLVYTILLRYWEWTPEEDVQPIIFLMSEGGAPYRSGTGRLPNIGLPEG